MGRGTLVNTGYPSLKAHWVVIFVYLKIYNTRQTRESMKYIHSIKIMPIVIRLFSSLSILLYKYVGFVCNYNIVCQFFIINIRFMTLSSNPQFF